MSHRRADVRAAVFQRRRSQGQLRAVTAPAAPVPAPAATTAPPQGVSGGS